MNAEKGTGPKVAKTYGVNGFPTILFLNAAGKKVFEIGGYAPPTDFLPKMQLAMMAVQLPELEAKPQKDALTLSKLAQIYGGQAERAKADASLAALLKSDPGNASKQGAIACNAVGDMYQTAGKFDKAIPLFEKAASLAKTGQERAYALMSIGVCYLSQGNKAGAKQYFEKTLALPDCPPLERGQTKGMLDSLK